MIKLRRLLPSVMAILLLLSLNCAAAKLVVNYTEMGVPAVDTSFKTWMSYKAITSKSSPQYKFVHTYGWRDSEGFMRCSAESDLGITSDYYLVAMGSYYGSTIGTKFRVTFDNGNVIYVALADQKADRHTNSTNQYASHNDVLEFLVDTPYLNKQVKRMGNANVYAPLSGRVAKIERMSFDWVEEESTAAVSQPIVTVSSGFSSYLLRYPSKLSVFSWWLWNGEDL